MHPHKIPIPSILVISQASSARHSVIFNPRLTPSTHLWDIMLEPRVVPGCGSEGGENLVPVVNLCKYMPE